MAKKTTKIYPSQPQGGTRPTGIVDIDLGAYSCPKCGFITMSQSHYAKHMKEEHNVTITKSAASSDNA